MKEFLKEVWQFCSYLFVPIECGVGLCQWRKLLILNYLKVNNYGC